MFRALIVALTWLGAVAPCATAADEVSAPMAMASSPFMPVYGAAKVPRGYVDFCDRSAQFCRVPAGEQRRYRLYAWSWRQLGDINSLVNNTIAQLSDREIYGEEEKWAMPQRSGDCEDLALLKRQLLLEKGWPASALLLTVVRDETGRGHAVLTVRTASGDYVLDNRHDAIKRWDRVPYLFIKRQSYLNPDNWVALTPRARDLTAASAHDRARKGEK